MYEKPTELTPEEAGEKIQMMWEDVYLNGANDSEHDQIQTILKHLQEGVLAPAEAVAQADAIAKRKMNYH